MFTSPLLRAKVDDPFPTKLIHTVRGVDIPWMADRKHNTHSLEVPVGRLVCRPLGRLFRPDWRGPVMWSSRARWSGAAGKPSCGARAKSGQLLLDEIRGSGRRARGGRNPGAVCAGLNGRLSACAQQRQSALPVPAHPKTRLLFPRTCRHSHGLSRTETAARCRCQEAEHALGLLRGPTPGGARYLIETGRRWTMCRLLAPGLRFPPRGLPVVAALALAAVPIW